MESTRVLNYMHDSLKTDKGEDNNVNYNDYTNTNSNLNILETEAEEALGNKNHEQNNSNEDLNNLNSFIIDENEKSDKLYIQLNRLLHSKRCIYAYIFLIISSFTIFFYSLVAYFFKLGK